MDSSLLRAFEFFLLFLVLGLHLNCTLTCMPSPFLDSRPIQKHRFDIAVYIWVLRVKQSRVRRNYTKPFSVLSGVL
jgi:hypothetical protein